MAFNPFLSMNEPAAPVAADVLNPFMMSADPEPDAYTGENPFAASNPFSDFGGYEPPAGDTVPVDIFGSADPPGIGAKHFDDIPTETKSPFDMFGTPDIPIEGERLVKPTELELITTTSDTTFADVDDLQESIPPARPLPPETQNLILNVTGQMEFASSHLLDRIPPTRTPSPVSLRDIHSPSPTPEPELPEDSAPVEAFDINRNKPVRPPAPPPARPPPAARPPPPRPAPPPKVPPPVPQPPAQAPVPEDINLFDAPVPAVVKPTKEAILSLYSAPKQEEKQVDFLSDDLLDDIPTSEANSEIHPQGLNNPPAPVTSQVNDKIADETVFTSPIANTFDASPKDATFTSATDNVGSAAMDFTSPMDCSEPPSDVNVPFNSSPFSDTVNDNVQVRRPSGSEKNPFEDMSFTEVTSAATAFSDTTTNIFGVTSEDTIMHNADITDTVQNNIFSTLPAEEGKHESEAFTSPSVDAFGTSPHSQMDDPFMSTQTTNADVGWGASEAMSHDPFPESQDAFDAFSAKFDSTSANHVNSGGYPLIYNSYYFKGV